MGSVFRILFLLLIIGGALLVAVMILRNDGSEGSSVATSSSGAASSNLSAKQKRGEAILNLAEQNARQKGGTTLDKRFFENMPNCIASLNAVSAEYQRRGIRSENMIDGTAFLGAAGKAVIFMDGEKVYILSCLDFAQTDGGAGYLQILTSEQQMKQSQAAPQ